MNLSKKLTGVICQFRRKEATELQLQPNPIKRRKFMYDIEV